MLEQIETTGSTLPTMLDPLQERQSPITEKATTETAPITTKNLNSHLSLGKPTGSKPTPAHNATIITQTKFAQRTIIESYTDLAWYNSPQYSHKSLSLNYKNANCNNTLPTKANMPLNHTIPGFESLGDAYIEISALINRDFYTEITDAQVYNADYELAKARHIRTLLRKGTTTEPDAKRSKNDSLPQSIMASIAEAFTNTPHLNVPEINTTALVLMDMELQRHRKLAETIDLTIDTHTAPVPTPPANIAAVIPPANILAVIPVIPTVPITPGSPADAAPGIGDDTTEPTTPVNRTLFGPETAAEAEAREQTEETEAPVDAEAKVFKHNCTPSKEKNKHHANAIVGATLRIHFATTMVAETERPFILTCKNEDNPRTALQAMFTIMGVCVPQDWLDGLFTPAHDYTKDKEPLFTILRNHKGEDYFNLQDYMSEATNHGLPCDVQGCFLGKNGGNFSKQGFTTTNPLLCQMEIEGNLVSPKPEKHYQWVIYIPTMNIVITCNDYVSTSSKADTSQTTWSLGKGTHYALLHKEYCSINKLLGKLMFPAKKDNNRNLKLNSAVWITNKQSNFKLFDDNVEN